jgi:hypothetical protein
MTYPFVHIRIEIRYAASKFYGDAYVANQTSTSGVDILGEGFQDFQK